VPTFIVLYSVVDYMFTGRMRAKLYYHTIIKAQIVLIKNRGASRAVLVKFVLLDIWLHKAFFSDSNLVIIIEAVSPMLAEVEMQRH